jgi:hypothetical protein
VKACPDCGHEMSLNMCWRLTCPSRGPMTSTKLLRDRAMRASAGHAQRLMRSSLFDPEPPEKAFPFVSDDDGED